MATEYRDPATEVVCDNNRKLVVGLGPIQPRLEKYKKTAIGQKTFSFQPRWFEIFPWLEYSESTDKAFCFYCRCFGTLGKL